MAITTRTDKGSELTHAELDENFTDLRDNPTGIVLPNTQNTGLKVDNATPDFPWHDIIGTINIIETAPSPASMASFIGGIYQPQFDEGDTAYINFHIPHDYVMNTDLYFHVHWSHNSTVVTGGSVTWGMEFSYAKGHQRAQFLGPINVAIVQNAELPQRTQHIAESVITGEVVSATQGDRSNVEPDGMLICRLYLDSNDLITSDLSVPAPFAHTADIHYRSTGVGTKNKAPDFWV